MNVQELNGITDWFEAGFDTVTSSVKDGLMWVGSGVESGYDWMSDKAFELTETAKATIKEFEDDVNALIAKQDQVDSAIAKLPENSPARLRLETKRDQSRGIFMQYVKPAWDTFQAWAGSDDAGNTGMGFVVSTTLVAVLGAISVAAYYVKQAAGLEEKILNDPDLKMQYVKQGGGNMSKIADVGKYAAIAIGLMGVVQLVKTFR